MLVSSCQRDPVEEELSMPESEAYVLPAAVRPTKYTLKLQPNMERSTFS